MMEHDTADSGALRRRLIKLIYSMEDILYPAPAMRWILGAPHIIYSSSLMNITPAFACRERQKKLSQCILNTKSDTVHCY